jgi:tRNA pseudouridine32 synthase/23S rRNA pseudouridine746 synthase
LPGTEQAPRLMLHASELRFVHPVSHEPMHIQQASSF